MNPVLEFTWDMFVDSPSRRDGIPMWLEKHYRATGCEFIGALSARFHGKIRGRIVCYACALYQQFYMRRSFASFDRWEVAVAVLSVATKNKGTTHALQELIVEALKLWRQRKGITQEDKNFFDRVKYWQSIIFRLELEVLVTLNGELGAFTAHACIGGISELVRDANDKPLSPDVQKEFLKKVVSLLKFAYRSVATLFYPAAWIGAATLYWAVERENEYLKTKYLKSNINHNSNEKTSSELLRPLQLQLPKEWYKNSKYFLGTRLDMAVIQYLVNEFKSCMTAEENGGVLPPNSYMIIPDRNKNRNKYNNTNINTNINTNTNSNTNININRNSNNNSNNKNIYNNHNSNINNNNYNHNHDHDHKHNHNHNHNHNNNYDNKINNLNDNSNSIINNNNNNNRNTYNDISLNIPTNQIQTHFKNGSNMHSSISKDNYYNSAKENLVRMYQKKI